MTLIMTTYRDFYGQLPHPEDFVIRERHNGEVDDVPLNEALAGTDWHDIIAYHPVRVLWNETRTVALVVKERLDSHQALPDPHCTVLVRKAGPDFKIIH